MSQTIKMASFPLFVSGILLVLASTSHGASDWAYKGTLGPNNWGENYPKCDLNAQSPINIYQGDVKPGTINSPIVYKNYDNVEGIIMKLKNTGYGAQVDISGTNLPEISGGNLPGTFKAAQFHLHWSTDLQTGSEHKISNQGFPGELHIVHFNTKYTDIGAALSQSDGLAVLGFMIQITNNDNKPFSTIVSSLGQVTTKDTAPVTLETMTLDSFLPAQRTHFYRYKGSLTTPPCDESVTWTLFNNSIEISADQLNALYDLRDKKMDFILNNARPLMPINGRVIEASFDPAIKWSYEGAYGVEHWKDYYESCGADKQSPVNIPSSAAEYNDIPVFTFQNFDSPVGIQTKMINDGHGLKVSYAGTTIPTISNGGLPAGEAYQVLQFHFHWGSDSKKGSEHTLDSKSYPLELHIVTYKSSLLSVTEALKASDGLAVLGFFFEIDVVDNPEFDSIIRTSQLLKNPDTEAALQSMVLGKLLPTDLTKFYRYSGSLTTPKCQEAVIWTVFNSKIKISETQMQKLRGLKSDEMDPETNQYKPLVNNYRPVYPLNSRVIKRNFEVEAKKKVEWTYFGITGTQNWKDLAPLCSSTKRQSPIDIQPKTVEYMNYPDFEFKNFDKDTSTKMLNNGHAVVVNYISGDLEMSGGGLENEHKVAQFHMHWGSVDTQGSEHTVDGKKFPMELHVVTYNKLYSSLGLAISQSNGLAVLGFMFEISETDNANLDPIISKLFKITEPKQEVELEQFALEKMLPPQGAMRFYRYLGSLTTPTCDESVTWTVFQETIPISVSQLNKFRALKSSEKDDKDNVMHLVDNFRPPQPLSGRQIYSNFFVDAGRSSGTTVVASLCTIVVSLAYVFSSLAVF